ncbi:MAG: 3-keto-5-aminohexanoate cleavage protein [Clostridiales bacterium]|nr:3-keto-5-aminohexanoate cleavage protein [Clostridiales bacterium]MDR2752077.1 3-keto-5-aminohexanoate cleavage protein [Clostridiales bacterium]
MAKTIITAALTGAITPAGYKIPETPEQIAAEAYEAWQRGAAIVHLHMRDENGLGVMDVSRFKETIYRIRSHKDCDVVINCTSSGDNRASAGDAAGNAKRMAHFRELDGIEMGSYDAGSFNWMPGGVFMNTPQFLQELGDLYIEKGIVPELEIFDTGMLGVVNYFLKKGHLKPPGHYQFCLGVLGAMPATVENLMYLIGHVPSGATWSAFGIGAAHMPVMYAALAMGGHIRVGLEDNVVYSRAENGQKVLATNNMLVERAVSAVKAFGNQPATPAEARKLLGIKEFEPEAVRAKLGIE